MSNKKQEVAIFEQLKANNNDAEVIAKLEDLISNHESCKNAYFWASRGGTLSEREAMCSDYYRDVTLNLDKGTFEVWQKMNQSRNHTYYKMYVYLEDSELELTNGNLKTLKSLLNLYNNQ